MFHLKLKKSSFILLQIVIFGLSMWSLNFAFNKFYAQKQVSEPSSLAIWLNQLSTIPPTLYSEEFPVEESSQESKITSDVNKQVIPFSDVSPDMEKKFNPPPPRRKATMFPRQSEGFRVKTDERLVFPSKKEAVVSTQEKEDSFDFERFLQLLSNVASIVFPLSGISTNIYLFWNRKKFMVKQISRDLI